MDLLGGRKFLDASGLNLFAVLAVDELPVSSRRALNSLNLDLQRYSSLVLIGSAGSSFWDQIQAQGLDGDHPFDDRSRELAWKFVKNYVGDVGAELVYPSSIPLPLIELGNHAGWSFPSQLGLGIHEIFGTWFSFRAVLLLAMKIPATKPVDNSESPCLSCISKPCVRQCPASAVKRQGAFNVRLCTSYRQQKKSHCQDRCLARIACPLGQNFQYSLSQMQYHARRSLASIINYSQKS
ncbi:hypothetical protein ACFL17_01805 [Pseudomonadota bacterium]